MFSWPSHHQHFEIPQVKSQHNFDVKSSDLRLRIYMRKISGVWSLHLLAEYPLQVRKFPDHIYDLSHDVWDCIQILHSVESIIDGGRITEGGTQPLLEQPLTFNTVNMQAYSNFSLVWLQWLYACNITLWTYQMEWRTGSVETTEFLPVTHRGRPHQGFSRSVHPVPEQLKCVMLDTWGQSIVPVVQNTATEMWIHLDIKRINMILNKTHKLLWKPLLIKIMYCFYGVMIFSYMEFLWQNSNQNNVENPRKTKCLIFD